MSKGRIILARERFKLTIERLCHKLIEEYGDFSNTCIIGVQERGVLLADRIIDRLQALSPKTTFEYGKLDITFYRDDFRRREEPLKASSTEIKFLIENKRVILIDDVLYTGRTIQAALAALQGFGRPAKVELLTLVDRRFNRHLPIQSDYTGITVDALDEAYVKVEWENIDGQDRIKLFSAKRNN
ncbi:MAG: bifunctional pyr operon transcriptional regulator/uracil phosphoribosyltransferase PyrR [Saprospiraceae bacterium]|nr:bifunctional pyr operon transcriptional regulator/uracil phosphoribosyltransferase PyrR [Saprospiraceae bacterium]